ncbi:hypothetical protein RvY_02928 [Ramazzottius varieornatus]|uniref:Uncharacterized protein n=1 Tax=Ramazzottius varieornatus TaxID=947166 RepID=A0A1D1US33_RAMVA|nr:hypothetical protein RvY_02928 [Ramazzottius varieornatus]
MIFYKQPEVSPSTLRHAITAIAMAGDRVILTNALHAFRVQMQSSGSSVQKFFSVPNSFPGYLHRFFWTIDPTWNTGSKNLGVSSSQMADPMDASTSKAPEK